MSKKTEVGVIGLGKFGHVLAASLKGHGHIVVGIDNGEGKIKRAQEVLDHVYQADATDKTALEQIGAQDLDHVVVSTGNSMEASILVALNLKELGVRSIWVKAISQEHTKILKRLGVDHVIFPEHDVARQVANRIAIPGIMDYLSLGEEIIIRELEVTRWEGKNLRDLQLPTRYQVQVVAMKRVAEQGYNFVPSADRLLQKGDVLVLLGNRADVLKASQQ